MAGVIALILSISAQTPEDSPEAVRRLIQDLRSEKTGVRDEARRRLKELGRKAAPELEKAARDGDAEVVATARVLLQALSVADGLPAKIRKEAPGVEYRLAEDRHAWTVVFLELARELPGDLDFEDLECLVPAALREATPGTERTDVIEYVESHEYRSAVPELLKLLGDREARKEAAWALAVLSVRDAVPKIMAMLQDEDEDVIGRAMSCLEVLNAREAVPELRKFLKHEDPFLVANASRVLCVLGDKASASQLIGLLQHDEFYVRLQTARAIGYLGDEAAIPSLIPLLKEKDAYLRSGAAAALGVLKARSAVPDLLARLKDEDPMVRISACYSLAGLESKQVAPAFADLLGDADLQVRLAALAGLGMLQAADSIDRIVPLLKDKDPTLKFSAARCLCVLGSREAVPAILEDGGLHLKLSTLNLLGSPRRTKRLGEQTFSGPREGTIAEMIAQLSQASEGPVDLPPIDPARSQMRIKLPLDGDRVTLYEAWDYVAAKLSGSGAVHLIVEEDRIRIMPHREALAYWTAWHRDQKK